MSTLKQMLLLPELETAEECTFQLESGTKFRVSAIDKMFVLGLRWSTGSGDKRIQCTSNIFKGRYLSQLIADRMGLIITEEIDHIDTDPFNNRRDNLRPATRSQQGMNKRIANTNALGRKGVRWSQGQYRVDIRINGKKTYIGSYYTLDAATRAYSAAITKYHGEFANHG